MSQMFSRERRSWTAKEDQLLREAVHREDPDNSNPSKWHAIAKHVPNRTNKDCRKRWFAKMASDVVKGGWAPDEDEKLVKGIERYGTRWSLVASVVQTRNSDQCAKRWTDTLNPAIDRTTWSSEADEILLRAVAEHGKVWTKIVKTYFPGRTGLSAKNRYNSITRFNSEVSRTTRPRRKSSEGLHYTMSRKSESGSSSSSASPQSPNMSLPFMSSSHTIDAKSHPYHQADAFSSWSSSSSVTSEDLASLRASPMAFDFSPQSTSPSTPSNDSAYQSYDISVNRPLSFPDSSHMAFPDTVSPPISQSSLYKNYPHHGLSGATATSNYTNYSHFPLVHGPSDITPDQFALFDGISSPDAGGPDSMNWDPLSPAGDSKSVNAGYKHFSSNNAFPYVF